MANLENRELKISLGNDNHKRSTTGTASGGTKQRYLNVSPCFLQRTFIRDLMIQQRQSKSIPKFGRKAGQGRQTHLGERNDCLKRLKNRAGKVLAKIEISHPDITILQETCPSLTTLQIPCRLVQEEIEIPLHTPAASLVVSMSLRYHFSHSPLQLLQFR